MVQALEELVDALCKLPAIGKKSAWRLALHLLERPEQESLDLAEAIIAARKKIIRCKKCFSYSETELCDICSSAARDQSLVCVVEKTADVFTIEKSGRFRGTYHVLGGVLSPINGVTADKIRIDELKLRVASNSIQELIIGLGSSADAESTTLFIARLFADTPVKVSRFARGLPAGTELDYVDQLTLSQALKERIDMRYGEERQK